MKTCVPIPWVPCRRLKHLPLNLNVAAPRISFSTLELTFKLRGPLSTEGLCRNHRSHIEAL